jgi:uncharacterized protein (TIGR02246 family)
MQPGAIMNRHTSVPEIDSLLASMLNAWNRHDLEAYVGHWVEDLDFVNVLGMHHETRDALLQELHFIHSGLVKGTQITDRGHSVRLLSDDAAIVHLHWTLTNVPYRPGYCETGVRQGVFTHVFRRKDGEWRIVASQNTDFVDPKRLMAEPEVTSASRSHATR